MLFALLLKTIHIGFACFLEITNYKNYFFNTPNGELPVTLYENFLKMLSGLFSIQGELHTKEIDQ
jgi:hypothetical protein